MQLSVIILNYNVKFFLAQCVLSVHNAIQNIDAEIIVVDNNSSDDSCSMMKSRFPNVKLIENTANVGFPKGNNIGVDIAKGKYICILNPDTIVAEDTFTKILAFAKRQENLGIVGCKLIDGTGNFLPESKRGVPTPWVAFTKIFGLYKFFPKSKFFNKYYAQHLLENQTGKVDILVGAFMVMERELYLEIGGFDEKCFMYSDDIDLSYMVLQKGKSNYYFHETSVIHYKGESTVKDGTYMKRFQEAMNFFYKKHFSSDGLQSVFFTVFMKIGIVFFLLLKKFQGKPKHKVEPENYFLISSPDALGENLRQKLENQLQKTVKIQNVTQSFSENGNTEIIFDNNYLDFKTIINAFETCKSKNTTFKILPKSSDYLIGSNSSLDRGEVLILD
jgi:GT2 family glycosyltransferase